MDEASPTAAHGPQRDLTRGPIGATLLAFAIPTLGSNVLQSLNGSINTIWVGRFLGENALAATSNANIIMFLMFGMVFGFGMAATIIVGQAWGRRDHDAARRAFGSAIGLVLAGSIVTGALGWIFAPQILTLLATPGDAYGEALAYLRVIFLGLPASMLLVLMFMGLRGIGDSLTPLWFMGLSVVLDAGLNPVFILGLGPAPELGIAGSATATLIANVVACAVLIGYIYLRDLPLRLIGEELRYILPERDLIGTIVGKGLPIGAQMLVISSAGLAMVGLVNRNGVDTTAAYGITQQLWTYIQMPAMAIGAAVSAMAAQNIGAGRWDRVGAITRSGIIYNLAITGAIIVVALLFDRPLLSLFVPEDSAVLGIAEHVNLVSTWGFVLFGVTMVLFGVVRANGAVWGPLAILFIAMFPVRLGVALALRPTLGADALWWSFPLGSATTVVLAALYYLHGGWRKGALLTPETHCDERSHADVEPGGNMRPAS
ncbi:putative efflux protein, MATE family [Sphingomonas palmae]|uniref:Putative efflux protein, MATE family n=1 Tax=Sphingomonas palmae TaxID=1855283 RepID=A0A1H7H2A0_9SPHN|nr:MATE family efflux transporter [Sphingomonas palmae]SEK44523.1 putative efflux protein, MATE family [Sphingomonas palmae]